jgi:hypothetical protein
MARGAFKVVPIDGVGGVERVNAGRAPDIRVRLRERRAAHRVLRGGGNGDEPVNTRSARVRQDAVEPLVDAVIEKVAVGVDHA